MKDAATKSYMKKGQDVVDTIPRAIHAGATAYIEIDVPAAWADAVDETESVELAGKSKLVKMVSSIMEPVGRMDGDSLPVSVFTDHVDGQFELGASCVREARHCRYRSHLGCFHMHPVQSVRVCAPACHHSSFCPD